MIELTIQFFRGKRPQLIAVVYTDRTHLFWILKDLEYFYFNLLTRKHTLKKNQDYEWCSCQTVVTWVAIHIFIRNLVSRHFISIQPPVEVMLINILLSSFHFNISNKLESRCFHIYGIVFVMKPNARVASARTFILARSQDQLSSSGFILFFKLSYNNFLKYFID